LYLFHVEYLKHIPNLLFPARLLYYYLLRQFWPGIKNCWSGLVTCKNRRPYNLYCVGGDVKPCSFNQLGIKKSHPVLPKIRLQVDGGDFSPCYFDGQPPLLTCLLYNLYCVGGDV